MSEISDLDEVDANNTSLTGIPVTNATLIAQLDDLVRAELGMLKRWFKSSLFRLRDSTDQTKLLAFDLSGLTTATTRTLTAPNASGTIALTSDVPIAPSCNGRLTLTTGVPITTADVTAAGTVYFTPYNGNVVGLYSGTAWVARSFSEVSILLSGGTASKPHDIFAYDNAGVLALELLAWTDDTTRATALVLQDGVLVKTGATTRRYLGSVYLNASKQAEDSVANRYLWNMYNRVARQLKRLEATDTWAYSINTFRQANATAANKLSVLRGLNENAMEAAVTASVNSSGATSRITAVAVGLDSTTVASTDCIRAYNYVNSSGYSTASAFYKGLPGLGRHDLNWLEIGGGSDTQTWLGDSGGLIVQSGMVGECFA